jgi:predicted phage terminase large subunit-like protein
LDDPVKNSQEAASPVIQRRNSLWWSSTFYTRAEPNAAIIVIQTRWHPKDLSGFLLERERVAAAGLEDPDADAAMLGAQQWHILAFDHERDPDTPWTLEDKDTPTTFPITCTVEPDPRAKGELLNPDRFPPEAVAAMRAQGSYTFSALQQQRPRAQEGNRFKAEWFPIVDATPAQVVKRVRYWDLAGTDPSQSADGEPDFTCGVRMSRGNDGLFYVEHVTRGQWSVARRDAHMKVSADADAAEFGVVLPDGTRAPNRTAVPQWHERESGIGGSERTRALSRALAGHIVHSDPPIGDKMSRAEPFAGQAEVGNVRLVKGDWNAAFIDELCAFPFGANDDTVDAASGAFAKVSDETSDIVTFTPGAVPVFSPFTV